MACSWTGTAGPRLANHGSYRHPWPAFFYNANGRLRAAHLGALTDANLIDAIGKYFQQKPAPPGTLVEH